MNRVPFSFRSTIIVTCSGLIFLFSAGNLNATTLNLKAEDYPSIVNMSSVAQQIPLSVRESLLLAPIHSRATLKNYLANTNLAVSPLRYFDSYSRQMFISSLTFNDNGLTGFSFSDFSQMSPTQIYEILQLFGAQYLTSVFAKGPVSTATDDLILQAATVNPLVRASGLHYYHCDGHHNCVYSGADEYCMPSC